MAQATIALPEVVWAPGRGFAIPAPLVQERIMELRDRDGLCSPQAFVDSARPEDDPLHEALEWDDFRAAEAHRRWQARTLINSVRIVENGVVSETPAFVHVRIVDEDGASEGYVDTAALRTNDEMRVFALMEARRYLQGAKKRYGHLNELSKVWDAIRLELDEAA